VRIKLDENMPESLVVVLSELGCSVKKMSRVGPVAW